MGKYLRVDIDTPYGSETEYEYIENPEELTEDQLASLAQEVMSNRYSCGGTLVDESEVPDDQK